MAKIIIGSILFLALLTGLVYVLVKIGLYLCIVWVVSILCSSFLDWKKPQQVKKDLPSFLQYFKEQAKKKQDLTKVN